MQKRIRKYKMQKRIQKDKNIFNLMSYFSDPLRVLLFKHSHSRALKPKNTKLGINKNINTTKNYISEVRSSFYLKLSHPTLNKPPISWSLLRRCPDHACPRLIQVHGWACRDKRARRPAFNQGRVSRS